MDTYFKFLPEHIINQKIQRGDFPFSQFLFWDTPVENINTEQHKNYIIERVISRGLLPDFYFLLKLYTTQEIKQALKKSKVLDKKTVNFCSHYFNIPVKEMYAAPYYS